MPSIEQTILSKAKANGINIVAPKTIQDKINWLKFHDSTPLKGKCADKIMVHDYVWVVLGEDICVPIIKVYDSVDQIKISDLPDKFVMKANHGYNMNIICKDKKSFNLEKVKPQLRKWLETNFGIESGQPHYAYIQPKIFVEELLEDDRQKESLFDYKFWCFNGEPKLWTINDGHGHGDIMYYDLDGNPVDLYATGANDKYTKPKGFEKMIEYAKKLSAVFEFVRVDFYEVNGKIYLGELTFTPGNGLFKYKKPGAAEQVGAMLNLDEKKNYEPGVSICLTAYNVQDFIEETLDSVQNQTWFKTHDNWEMIVGIDGCMKTLEKVRSIMGKYKHLRVFMMQSNCGTYVTTNTVMAAAKYDGLIRFDCDDIMAPTMVETIMKEKDDADYVYFQMENFGKKVGVTKTCGQVWMSHSVFDEFGGYLPWTCSADAELEIRMKHVAKIKHIKKVLMKRRVHEGNLTRRKETSYTSALRGENNRYISSYSRTVKTKQDAVIARFTNSYIEIFDKDTPFTPSKNKFPKLDMVYMNKTEWKLKRDSDDKKTKFSSVLSSGHTADKGDAYRSVLSKNYIATKREAAEKLKTFLNS